MVFFKLPVISFKEACMLRSKGFIIILSAFLGVLFLDQAKAFTEEAATNEELLNEIRDLKRTVQQQQQKIEELEKRLLKQEAASGAVGQPIAVSEIDKRIDERLSRRVPSYQLMEGLSLGLEATTIIQGGHHLNGDDQLSKSEDATDATMTTKISFEKKFGDYAEGYVLLKAGQGEGLDRALKTYGNVNDNADDNSNVHISEAWYEAYFKQISAALAFGKLDPTNYIDTNDYANTETTQFLGGLFCNSPVVEFPSSNAAGLHFGLAPYDLFDINLVALDGKGEWNNVFDSMFLAGQINFKPKFLGRPGNYRLLAWSNGTSHTKWTDTSKEKENSYGYGLSFDQELTDVIGLFARYGWQDPDVYVVNVDDPGSEFSLEQAFSIGPQFKGTAWGRPNDIMGIGFGQIIASNKYKTAKGLRAKTESHLECYYNFQVNDHLSLSPDLQIIWQPYGKDATNGDGTIVVGGLRGQMEF
jgi:high affinity Mn2+ porin